MPWNARVAQANNERVPFSIPHHDGVVTPSTSKTVTMAPTSKYLAQSNNNKSLRRGQATKKRGTLRAARRNFVRWPS
jgi:hypothetical protein